jgi:hypothetical protein
MTKENINKENEIAPDVFEMIASAMTDFREEMEYSDEVGSRIAAKTRFIMRAVLTILIMSSIYLVYMIYLMASNMTHMTAHLENMYSSFGLMSQNMHEITQTVGSMSSSISGIPVIAESMNQIDIDVIGMKGSVYEINQSMAAIDNDMVKINLNMQEMTGRLSNMNRSVNTISYDVNGVSLPMNSGPMSGFWPK